MEKHRPVIIDIKPGGMSLNVLNMSSGINDANTELQRVAFIWFQKTWNIMHEYHGLLSYGCFDGACLSSLVLDNIWSIRFDRMAKSRTFCWMCASYNTTKSSGITININWSRVWNIEQSSPSLGSKHTLHYLNIVCVCIDNSRCLSDHSSSVYIL